MMGYRQDFFLGPLIQIKLILLEATAQCRIMRRQVLLEFLWYAWMVVLALSFAYLMFYG
jgi:hypothetical protein